MPLTAVITQAHMGSTRLPGKVMMPLAGKTVLAHVIERCRAIADVDVVCCATTEAADDDAIVAEAERCGARVFRGSESDVLARYWGAAKMLGAEVIMRITSDCPLIDPEVCAAVIRLRAERGVDYAANNMPPGWPHGLDCEVFTFAALDHAAREARAPDEREHVTPWIRTHPAIGRANLAGPGGPLIEHRWTLDFPEDMQFFQAVFAHFPPPAMPRMAEVLALLERHPEIAAINRNRRDAARTASPPASQAKGGSVQSAG